MRRIIFHLILITSFSFLKAQTTLSTDSLIADSLINELERTQSINEKIRISEEICFWLREDLQNSPCYIRKGIAYAKEANDIFMCSKFHNMLGGYYDMQGIYDSSLFYFEKAYVLGVESEDKRRQLSPLLNIANSYTRQGEYALALEYYMQVLSINEKDMTIDPFMDTHRQMMVLSNIAEIYLELKNYDRSLYYVELADKISEENGHHDGKMQIYYILGGVYLGLKAYDKALDYQLKSAAMSHDISYITYECYSMLDIAKIYIEQKEYSRSMEYIDKALELTKRLNDLKLRARGLVLKATIYYEQKDYRLCESVALEAWMLDSMSLDTGPDITLNIAMANFQLGNTDKADVFFRKYDILKNQYIDKNYRETMIDMEFKYETEKKELRIVTLEREKKLYIWLGIAGFIILLAACMLFLFRHRLHRQQCKIAEQQIKQLEQEKQLIATQAILDGETAERSRMARDLHDGLGGLLSLVKLNLNNLKKMDENAEEKYDKTFQVIDKSIEELRRVAHHLMPESLICNGLRTSLGDFIHAIPGAHFYYYGSEERLDERLEVVLYRCVYELINNAVKYAEATTINVQLMVDNSLVSLTVQDNGIGFDPEKISSGSGLANIRTRASAYNGKMMIFSAPGKGTEVSVEIERTPCP